MQTSIKAALIGATLFFQQATTAENAQAQSFQQQMNDVIERHAGPDPLQQALYVAIWNDNVEMVNKALNAGAVPNAKMVEMAIKDSSFYVQEYPDEPIVQIYQMVTHDIYLSQLTEDELSQALFAAASPGNAQAVQRLIANGADPNRNFDDYSPKLPAALAASNMLTQLERGNQRSQEVSEDVVQAFIDGGLTRETAMQHARRDDVKAILLEAIDQKAMLDPASPTLNLD